MPLVLQSFAPSVVECWYNFPAGNVWKFKLFPIFSLRSETVKKEAKLVHVCETDKFEVKNMKAIDTF